MGHFTIHCHIVAHGHHVMTKIGAVSNHALFFDVSVYFIDSLDFSEPQIHQFVYNSSLGRPYTLYGNYVATSFVLPQNTYMHLYIHYHLMGLSSTT